MIKNNLKIIRKHKGLTLRKLSELSGIDNSHIAKIENGKTRLNTDSLRILAKALQVSPEELIREDLILEEYPSAKAKSNLTILREKAGLTQVEIAEKLKVTKQYISLLEKDKSKINESIKQKLAEILNTSPEQIIAEPSSILSNQEEDKPIVHLPFYDYKLSAGKGTFLLNESINQNDYFLIPILKEFLEKITGTNAKYLIILPIKGNSMEPTYKDESLAIVDTTVTELTDHGGVYAFDYNGESYLKRIQKTPEKLIIISDNKKYKDWNIPLPPKYEFKLIGKVKKSFGFNDN